MGNPGRPKIFHMKSIRILPVLCLTAFLSAQIPQPSNQTGTVQQIPLEESKSVGKSAHLPGLDFYAAVVNRLLDGADEPNRVWVWQKKGEVPKPKWYIQTHVAPSFSEDSLFSLRELTDETVELVAICPQGGINLWYQLSTPCMTEKPLTVDEAIARLAFVRFQLSEKQFPAIRDMMEKFKGIKFPAFVSPIRMVLDGVSYDFKVKSPVWSYELHTSNPDEDFPLAVWAESCAADIWKFLRSSKEFGFKAHPLITVDKDCIGPAILRADAGSGDLEEVDCLIRLGVDVNSADFWNHETALMTAVQNHQLPMIKKLLSAGANPKHRDSSGRSMFHILPDTLTRDLGKLDGELAEAWKETLVRAKDRIQIADLLKANGTDLEAANDRGETPLMASIEARDLELAGWFIRQGADAARKDKNGKSARDRAVDAKIPAMVRVIDKRR